jgi:predicted metal-binding protein
MGTAVSALQGEIEAGVMPSELLVCTTCRAADAPRDEPAAGERLLAQLLALAAGPVAPAAGGAPRDVSLVVRGIACLGVCSRSCSIALQAAHKMTYVFGDLAPDAESAEQVLACARQHAHAPDGLLAWASRPERLRRGLVARLPPLQAQPTESTDAPSEGMPS